MSFPFSAMVKKKEQTISISEIRKHEYFISSEKFVKKLFAITQQMKDVNFKQDIIKNIESNQRYFERANIPIVIAAYMKYFGDDYSEVENYIKTIYPKINSVRLKKEIDIWSKKIKLINASYYNDVFVVIT